MRSELPAISFLCFAFIAAFIPFRRVRCDVVNLAIVSWLAGCNLVHGINGLVWAGNVEIRVPVWCDIGMVILVFRLSCFYPDVLFDMSVTKLLLAAIVAVSGAFLCMSRHLELLSSIRPISANSKSQRNRVLIEAVLCYITPVIYMAIRMPPPLTQTGSVGDLTVFLADFIVQDHRFDLVKDIGCSASIHPSSPALILMWLPPLIICSITFYFSGTFRFI